MNDDDDKQRLIVAGNEKQAAEWERCWRQVHGDFQLLRAYVTGKPFAKYVRYVTDLYGAYPDTHEIVFWGTYYERKDIEQIYNFCRTRGF